MVDSVSPIGRSNAGAVYGLRPQLADFGGGSGVGGGQTGARRGQSGSGDAVDLSAAGQSALDLGTALGRLVDSALDTLPQAAGAIGHFLTSGLGLSDRADLPAALKQGLTQPAADQLRGLLSAPGKTQALTAGASYLALDGIELSIHQTDHGVDFHFAQVSVRAAAAYGSDGRSGYAGFAAEISETQIDIHLEGGNAADLPLVLKALGPDDPRRLTKDGQARTDVGYLPDLEQALNDLTKIKEAWKEYLAQVLGDDRAARTPLPDRPTLIIGRDAAQTDDGARFVFDLLAPLTETAARPAQPRGGVKA